MPEIVIYLPVHNGGTQIEAAVRSVLAQTHQSWRLVILENASTDGTPDRLAQLADDRISVRPASRLLSMHANWHRAYEAMGEEPDDRLVTILGHDDLFHPDFLADIVELATIHPDASCYQTLFDMIDENDNVMRPCRPVPRQEDWMGLLGDLMWIVRDSFGTGYVFRAGDYRRVGGIPDLPKLLFSDWIVFARLTRLSYKACTLESRFSYRRHTGSMSGTPSAEKFAAVLNSLAAFLDIVRSEFSEFADTAAGRSAQAALLARELSLLTVPMIKRTFSAKDEAVLERLVRMYDTVADGVPLSTMVGQPYQPSRLFIALRRFNAAQKFLRYTITKRLG